MNGDHQMDRRIGIILWEPILGVVPSLINAIHMLSEAGYNIDVITRHSDRYAAPPRFSSSVRVVRLSSPGSGGIESALIHAPQTKNFFRKVIPSSLRKMYWNVRRSLLTLPQRLQFIGFAWRAVGNHQYTCFIGVDRDGLVAASAIGFLRKAPILYWSLEIRFLNDYRDPSERILKHLEKISHRKAQLTITQDWERADCLANENGVDLSKFVIVPNGPLGPSPNVSGDYFQRKFGLSPSQRIVLYAGMISPGYLSLELARAASCWPDEWTLVFHEREKRDPSEPYLQEVQKEGKDRVRLSLEPVPYDELDSVVSSGHIGIVAYSATLGSNWRLMAGASGKLAHYLRCGLPVVCVDCPSLGKIIQEYQCGMEVPNVQDAEGAIRSILASYDLYRANAIRCYNEVYEFGVHFRQVLQEIEALNGQLDSSGRG